MVNDNDDVMGHGGPVNRSQANADLGVGPKFIKATRPVCAALRSRMLPALMESTSESQEARHAMGERHAGCVARVISANGAPTSEKISDTV